MAHVSDRWHRKDRTRTERYGRGLRWQVEWADTAGGKRKRSFANKDLAEDFLTEIRHEQKRGVYRAPDRACTVGDLYRLWMDSHPEQRENTRNANLAALRMFREIADQPAEHLTRRQVQAAVNALLLDYAPNTIRAAYGKLGSALKWAHIEELITANPCRGIRLPAKPADVVTPLSPEEVRTIAETMRVPAVRAMVLFAAATGLRAGELRGVTWQAIRDGQLNVTHQLDGPGSAFVPLKTANSRRRIALGPETLQVITALREEIGAGQHGEVFHHDGKGYASRSLNRSWELMRERSGITASGWHQLRHYHASQLIAAGFSPAAVARRLGHTPAEVLATYAHMYPSDDAAMASLGDATLRAPSDTPAFRVIPGAG